MTKQAEMDYLRQFAESLPADSYLWPWLVSVIPQVESEIRSDFMVSPSILVTRAECDRMKADAQKECDQIRFHAEQTARRTIEAARSEADRIRHGLSTQIRGFLTAL